MSEKLSPTKQRFVKKNLRLAYKVAWDFCRRFRCPYFNDEMESVCLFALCRAAKSFRKDVGVKFGGYFGVCAERAMLGELLWLRSGGIYGMASDMRATLRYERQAFIYLEGVGFIDRGQDQVDAQEQLDFIVEECRKQFHESRDWPIVERALRGESVAGLVRELCEGNVRTHETRLTSRMKRVKAFVRSQIDAA